MVGGGGPRCGTYRRRTRRAQRPPFEVSAARRSRAAIGRADAGREAEPLDRVRAAVVLHEHRRLVADHPAVVTRDDHHAAGATNSSRQPSPYSIAIRPGRACRRARACTGRRLSPAACPSTIAIRRVDQAFQVSDPTVTSSTVKAADPGSGRPSQRRLEDRHAPIVARAIRIARWRTCTRFRTGRSWPTTSRVRPPGVSSTASRCRAASSSATWLRWRSASASSASTCAATASRRRTRAGTRSRSTPATCTS